MDECNSLPGGVSAICKIPQIWKGFVPLDLPIKDLEAVGKELVLIGETSKEWSMMI